MNLHHKQDSCWPDVATQGPANLCLELPVSSIPLNRTPTPSDVDEGSRWSGARAYPSIFTVDAGTRLVVPAGCASLGGSCHAASGSPQNASHERRRSSAPRKSPDT